MYVYRYITGAVVRELAVILGRRKMRTFPLLHMILGAPRRRKQKKKKVLDEWTAQLPRPVPSCSTNTSEQKRVRAADFGHPRAIEQWMTRKKKNRPVKSNWSSTCCSVRLETKWEVLVRRRAPYCDQNKEEEEENTNVSRLWNLWPLLRAKKLTQ